MSVLLMLAIGATPSARGQDLDSAAKETVYLLNRALTTRDGRERDRLLGAVRRLRDPRAAGLYRHLSGMSDPFRQSHGLLGMVEAGLTPSLTLDTVLSVEDDVAQAELVQAALNDGLIDAKVAAQWIGSSRLTARARVELARYLLSHGHSVDPAVLRDPSQSDNKRLRVLANVLLVQAGDASGLNYLRTLAGATDAESQSLTVEALNLASELNLDKLGPWAFEVSQKTDIDQRIAQPALAIALKLRAPQAASVWQRTFKEETDGAIQMRLAMYALNAAPFIDAKVFDVLLASPDATIQMLGRAGRAIALKQNIDEAVLEIVQLNHLPFSAWALAYAHEHASAQDAQAILLGLILAFETAPRNARTLNAHLDLVERAVSLLYDRDPEGAIPLLRAVITKPDNEPLFVRRVLTGLFNCEKPGAYRVLEGLPAFEDRAARLMALVLLTMSDQPMTQDQLQEVSLLVRGGGGLLDQARLQVGWVYLKRTNQLDAAVTRAISGN